MKKTVLPALVIALFFGSGIVQAQDYKGPRIAVSGQTYDLGKVPQGTLASHVFEIRNAGTEPLVIERVQPS